MSDDITYKAVIDLSDYTRGLTRAVEIARQSAAAQGEATRSYVAAQREATNSVLDFGLRMAVVSFGVKRAWGIMSDSVREYAKVSKDAAREIGAFDKAIVSLKQSLGSDIVNSGFFSFLGSLVSAGNTARGVVADALGGAFSGEGFAAARASRAMEQQQAKNAADIARRDGINRELAEQRATVMAAAGDETGAEALRIAERRKRAMAEINAREGITPEERGMLVRAADERSAAEFAALSERVRLQREEREEKQRAQAAETARADQSLRLLTRQAEIDAGRAAGREREAKLAEIQVRLEKQLLDLENQRGDAGLKANAAAGLRRAAAAESDRVRRDADEEIARARLESAVNAYRVNVGVSAGEAESLSQLLDLRKRGRELAGLGASAREIADVTGNQRRAILRTLARTLAGERPENDQVIRGGSNLSIAQSIAGRERSTAETAAEILERLERLLDTMERVSSSVLGIEREVENVGGLG